jgi:hypothetical protein
MFLVTTEFRSPVSLFTHTQTQNTEHKHTTPNTRQQINKRRATLSPIRAGITLEGKAPRGVVCTRERLHGNATRRDAGSFWRMVMQHFRRIQIFFLFLRPLVPPRIFHLLCASLFAVQTEPANVPS